MHRRTATIQQKQNPCCGKYLVEEEYRLYNNVLRTVTPPLGGMGGLSSVDSIS